MLASACEMPSRSAVARRHETGEEVPGQTQQSFHNIVRTVACTRAEFVPSST
jgi:hypothetical protein